MVTTSDRVKGPYTKRRARSPLAINAMTGDDQP